MSRILAISIGLTLLSTTAMAGWFGLTGSYKECVEDNIGKTTDVTSQKKMKQKCRAKYPDKEKSTSDKNNCMAVPSGIAEMVTVQLRYNCGDSQLSGTVYNGSYDYVINEMVIYLEEKMYTVKLTARGSVTGIKPQETGGLYIGNINMSVCENYPQRIEKICGYRIGFE